MPHAGDALSYIVGRLKFTNLTDPSVSELRPIFVRPPGWVRSTCRNGNGPCGIQDKERGIRCRAFLGPTSDGGNLSEGAGIHGSEDPVPPADRLGHLALVHQLLQHAGVYRCTFAPPWGWVKLVRNSPHGVDHARENRWIKLAGNDALVTPANRSVTLRGRRASHISRGARNGRKSKGEQGTGEVQEVRHADARIEYKTPQGMYHTFAPGRNARDRSNGV